MISIISIISIMIPAIISNYYFPRPRLALISLVSLEFASISIFIFISISIAIFISFISIVIQIIIFPEQE